MNSGVPTIDFTLPVLLVACIDVCIKTILLSFIFTKASIACVPFSVIYITVLGRHEKSEKELTTNLFGTTASVGSSNSSTEAPLTKCKIADGSWFIASCTHLCRHCPSNTERGSFLDLDIYYWFLLPDNPQ